MTRSNHLTSRLGFLILYVVSTHAALAAPVAGKATIKMNWSPSVDQPTDAEINGFGSAPLQLKLDPQDHVFLADYQYDSAIAGDPSQITLTAKFGDGHKLWVPLRVRPGAAVSTTVFRPRPAACTPSGLGPIEQPSGDLATVLERYYTAMVALQLPDDCGPIMLKRVTKAWFDRSVDLVVQSYYYRWNDVAAAAYAKYEPDYVKGRKREDNVANFRLKVDWRKDESAAGSTELVRALTTSLVAELTDDRDLRETVARADGITLAQLNEELSPRRGPIPRQQYVDLSAIYGNTVVLTDAKGSSTTFHFKVDGSFATRTPTGQVATGTWKVRDGKVCSTIESVESSPLPPSQQGEYCAAYYGRKVGDKWNSMFGNGQQVSIEIKAGS